MKHRLGIDLGTYNSSAAVAVQRDTVMVQSKDGALSLNGKNFPSFVQFDSKGSKMCVGAKAQKNLLLNPLHVIWGVKRLVGLSYQSAVDETRRFKYDIERGPGDGILIRVGNERFTPSHILEIILREIKEDAENERLNPLFGKPFEEAVISVPAYYKAIRTAPIIEAALQAGFKEVHTIAEPTAAAVQYGLQIDREAVILAFDLGAGTLDVTVLQIVQDGDNLIAGELCTSGHEALGGLDMDDLLLEHLVKKHKILPTEMEQAVLREEIEAAKIRLSRGQKAKVEFPLCDITLTRDELAEVLGGLLNRCRAPIQMAIKDAGLEASGIDHVLLIGGPTNMPCVRRVVRDELASLGARLDVLAEIDAIEQRGFPVSPMECVSRGAALKAAGVITPACTSMPEGLGTVFNGSHYGPIIKENSMYPVDGRESILFPNPNAKTISVPLVSKRSDPDKYAGSKPAFRYEHLGDFNLSVIPTGDLHSVELVLSVSKEKKLTATLVQQQTGIQVTYQNPDSMKNEAMDLVDDGNFSPWDKSTLEAMRGKYNRELSAWTTKQLEDCAKMAMQVLELASGYHDPKLQQGIKVLQSSLGAISYTIPDEAARLANCIREFLDLLRQPEIGVIKAEEFRLRMAELKRITS
ncbi:MAG TPA: Hsp70 family protein [Candidatus Saccharimonadales bacterium]|jgi:molecular chaperone DnaK|nr:Hsp70 family protein [Candidatus Saccharimonadales bacterium]